MEATASTDAMSSTGEMPGWVPPLARAGYAAKGVVYLGVGWLSASAAFGRGGDAAGSREAIATMARETGGVPALWIIGVGLVGYVVWRMVQTFLDPEDDGAGKRAVHFVSGALYAGLAFWTIRAALGSASAAQSGGGGSGWTRTLLEQPFGRWVVMAAGLATAGYGLVQFWRAYRARVADRLKPELPSGTRTWVVRSARVGLAARGVVMLVIGGLLLTAGWQSDPDQPQGLGGALATLREQPYGPWLMGAVAVGLAAYGLYQLVQARYRRIGPVSG